MVYLTEADQKAVPFWGVIRSENQEYRTLAKGGRVYYSIPVSDLMPFLFVYGTLRRGSGSPQARLLSNGAQWIGAGHAQGRLYDIAGYPGFVPDAHAGQISGDLFLMNDPGKLLPLLDTYEECTDQFPEPHEYRRQVLPISTTSGTVKAWTYVYAWPVDTARIIASGDFLA